MVSRRNFMGRFAAAATGSVAGGASLAGRLEATSVDLSQKTNQRPLFVSTWPFGKDVNDQALKTHQQEGSLLDAVEQGIWVAEADADNASVGLGGLPKAGGAVQLDACIMDGPEHRAGSVSGLEDILHPISVARRVMESTPHVMLTGAGAREFALKEGFKPVNLLTEQRRKEWLKWRETNKQETDNHDTIALLALGEDNTVAGGCSTSGWGYALPGRVGDSPIIGGGLYVDNEIGAAGSTGLGENVMRYCATFMVVEFMRMGLDPQSACIATIERIARTDPRGMDLSVYFIALDKKGRFGAAGVGDGFQYAITTPQRSELLHSAALGMGRNASTGGNVH